MNLFMWRYPLLFLSLLLQDKLLNERRHRQIKSSQAKQLKVIQISNFTDYLINHHIKAIMKSVFAMRLA